MPVKGVGGGGVEGAPLAHESSAIFVRGNLARYSAHDLGALIRRANVEHYFRALILRSNSRTNLAHLFRALICSSLFFNVCLFLLLFPSFHVSNDFRYML